MPSLRRRVVKPFKFFDHIVDHPKYLDTIKEAWNCVTIRGTYQFKLQRSLKLLKGSLRNLNKIHFSGITQRVKDQTDTVRLEHEERAKWQFLIRAEEKFYMQKSRVRWNHLGDRDIAFYHKTVVQRADCNHIHFLRDADDVYIGSIDQIKAHSASYFENTLGHTDMPSSPCTIRELQDLLSFRCSDAQCGMLSRPVSDEEITKMVFAMPLSKSPGPDGYSIEFFRSAWSIVGPDVIAAVNEFFINDRLLKDFNNMAIALIPKVPQACKLGDFRPISCCNLIYKIISKIIFNRLKGVLQDNISLSQSAFLKGRSLGENVLPSSELIRDYGRTRCEKSSMLKVDIKKAFDTVHGILFLNF